ncbi:MAG TPA: outer membrane beta-barrel protein [Longimicrobiales bacterium]|nr:outer membrane beta-barrel protein [Longimicrobiales bacterium]
MKKLLCTVAVAGALVVPGAAQAQVVLGPMAGFHTEDAIDAFGIGAFASFEVPSLDENLSITPSFIYYFPDDPRGYWELNGDVVYNFEVSPDTPVLPFAMAGLNIARFSVDLNGASDSDTEIGLNLGGGVTFRAANVEPFAGAKFELQDETGFVLFGGVGFPVGN